jgi:hypothetical protein
MRLMLSVFALMRFFPNLAISRKKSFHCLRCSGSPDRVPNVSGQKILAAIILKHTIMKGIIKIKWFRFCY